MKLEDKTKRFSLSIINLMELIIKNYTGKVLGKQLLRSATSIGAQYREACRARSKLEFISKIESSIQECNETIYWLELIQESKILSTEIIQPIYKEAQELIAMLVSSVKTAKKLH